MTSTSLARVLKIVNIAIAVVAVAALGIVYWYVWRPLPQRSGTIDAPLNGPASVSFDTLGVPHIQASSVDDALFIQGYVTAQDRLWQMDALRRYSAGTLAEILGPVGLDSDKESRRLRLSRIAEDAYQRLPPADRAAFAAYSRGVNWFISTRLRNLPLEFSLLKYEPRPWSVLDCVLLCLHMFRNLTTSWRDEIIKRDMLAEGEHDKVEFLFPIRSGYDPAPGSNAWAIAGSRTASGKPLLSNDMHLEYSLPGIWYMAHLEAPGLDVSGVTLPGTPGVIAGHNQRIAWGLANLQFDVQDLYIEKFDDRTGRYLYKGQVEQAHVEREIIRVKGQAPVEMLVWVTRHGPLFVSEGNSRMALRWAAAEPGAIQYPVLEIDRAANWQQFTTAISRWPGPGSNFVYADVDGNIAYHAAGRLPKRVGYRGDLPVDGSSGDYDWDGFIPFEELPSTFNPASGIVASSNQDTFPPGFPHPVNGNFAAPYRAIQVRALLNARNGWRAEDQLTVQKDVYSGFSKFLAGQVVTAYANRHGHNPGLESAVGFLRDWNGQMDKDLAAPFIITLIYQHVRSTIAERAAPGKGAVYEFPMAPAVIERLLRERPAGWFQSYDEILLRALADGVEEGTRMQGRDIQHWKYGTYLRISINHPVIHQIPLVGRYFDVGPVAMSGSSTTVKQTTQRLGPSMRLNADLGDWEKSLLNITIGQSGQILSSHYRDQWPAYYEARSFPMQFGKVDAKSTLTFRAK
jgi:penicillin amidase